MALPPEVISLAPHLVAVGAATGLTVAARKAIGRVTGGIADIMLGPLEDVVQARTDRRQAKSLVRKAIAEAAAAVAAGDDELVKRALATEFGEITRKQKAREKVAEIAEDLLKSTPPHDGDAAEVDEDWLNVFISYAEKASSERMQLLWGKVLAGEISSAGNFSIHSMRLLSEMTANSASLLTKAVKKSIGDVIINELCKFTKQEAAALEAIGLISGSGDTLNISVDSSHPLNTLSMEGEFGLGVSTPSKIQIGVYVLSPVGIELRRLVTSESAISRARTLAKELTLKYSQSKFHVMKAVSPTQARVLETF